MVGLPVPLFQFVNPFPTWSYQLIPYVLSHTPNAFLASYPHLTSCSLISSTLSSTLSMVALVPQGPYSFDVCSVCIDLIILWNCTLTIYTFSLLCIVFPCLWALLNTNKLTSLNIIFNDPFIVCSVNQVIHQCLRASKMESWYRYWVICRYVSTLYLYGCR